MNVVGAGAWIHPRADALGVRARVLVGTLEGFVGSAALFGGYHLLADAEGFGVERWS